MSEFNHFFNKIILYFFFQKVAVSTPTLMNDAKFQKHLFLFFYIIITISNLYNMRIE